MRLCELLGKATSFHPLRLAVKLSASAAGLGRGAASQLAWNRSQSCLSVAWGARVDADPPPVPQNPRSELRKSAVIS